MTAAPRARYVAIITDGNGRWAERRNLPVGEGHRAGAENVRARLRDAAELGVEELTIYAFSTENWERPGQEVQGLLALLAEYIDGVTPELHAEGVRLRFIGDRGSPLPTTLVERMEWAEELTDGNRRITFFVPFNYGGRAEILRAGRGLRRRRRGRVRPRPLRAGDAQPPADDQDERRAAALQLPAVAAGRLRADLPRRALARILAPLLRRVTGRVRAAAEPQTTRRGSGSPLRAGLRSAWKRAPRERRHRSGSCRTGKLDITIRTYTHHFVNPELPQPRTYWPTRGPRQSPDRAAARAGQGRDEELQELRSALP